MKRTVTIRNMNSASPARVLLAVGDVGYGLTISKFVEGRGFDVDRCHDAKGVLRMVGRASYNIIVLDLGLSTQADVDLVSYTRQRDASTQLILLFDLDRIEQALEGIRRGAFFYLPKSSAPSDVALLVEKAAQTLATRARMDRFEQTMFEELAGNTPAMQRVIELITKVAPTDSTILLLGESGTGKEVFANSIHRLSQRRDQPFIAINCAALPESLLESELFGHVKGAFTGAESDKRGLFEEADKGTVFLDEIGDMALVTQAKLLRVLQNGEIRRVGASQIQRVDVRIIAATNRDLAQAVKDNQFREDLYFRLNVITIRIPPLRERMDALPVLTNHFIAHFNRKFGKQVRSLDENATALLNNYAFPGNVRELESVIAHAVILADSDEIRPRDLPEHVQYGSHGRRALTHTTDNRILSLAEMEDRHIRQALHACHGNQTLAAKQLGISRSTLWRKMSEYGIDKDT